MKISKEDFVTTALRLFRTMPYNDVSISRICAEVGVTKGSFFHHFENKEELFRQAVEHFEELSLTDFYDDGKPLSLWEFCQAYLDFFWSHEEEEEQNFGRDILFLEEAYRRLPSIMETHRESVRRDVERWSSVIERAKASGEIVSSLPSSDLARLFLSIEDSVLLEGFITHLPAPQARLHMEARFRTIYQMLKP